MSFFKDFKADFTQAMNELMPDSNEMFDEDMLEDDEASGMSSKADEPVEEADDSSVTENVSVSKRKNAREKKEKPVKEKKAPKEKKTKLSKPVKNVSAKDDALGESMDIAPEDMLDQIDDLLNQELYSDEAHKAALLSDDLEVNTMDMSVEELLSQLSEQQEYPMEDTSDSEDVSIDDLLNELQSEEQGDVSTESTISSQEQEPVEEGVYIREQDMGLEALLDSISGKKPADDTTVQTSLEQSDAVAHGEEAFPSLDVPDTEEMQDLEALLAAMAETPLDEAVELQKEPVTDEVQALPEEPEAMETEELPQESVMDETEELPEEPEAMEIEELSQESQEISEDLEALTEETVSETIYSERNEKEQSQEDNRMSEEKEVVSTASQVKANTSTKNEPSYNFDDSETTYITKGTNIKGDLETDGSIDIIGTIAGNVSCKGKVVVGGSVTGDVTAGELYANGARIEGNVKSYGSVKVGVGSMIIGAIEGESAVIAGAVNGDIDVKGPVIVDSTAVIMGNIKSRSVQINNGAVIEGFCSQSYSDIDVKSFFA